MARDKGSTSRSFLVVGHNTAEAVSGTHRQGCGNLADLFRFRDQFLSHRFPVYVQYRLLAVGAAGQHMQSVCHVLWQSIILAYPWLLSDYGAVHFSERAVRRIKKSGESDSEWIHSLSFGPCCAVNLKILLGFYCKRWRRSHHARRRMSPSCRTMPTTTCPPPGSRSRKSS